MDKELILEKVSKESPRLIYISGKTCTGKTTFANLLSSNGYLIVELDKIVTNSVVIPFGVAPGDGFRTAYRDMGPSDQVQSFVSAAKAEISSNLKNSSIVVEGGVAKPRILQEIFSDVLKDFLFIYFHPIRIDSYVERITSRFIAGNGSLASGLPKDFWALVREKDLDEYKSNGVINEGIQNSVREFAVKSMEESKERLEGFQEFFQDIAVIEV